LGEEDSETCEEDNEGREEDDMRGEEDEEDVVVPVIGVVVIDLIFDY
jgi:hypothetical protein